MNAVDNLLAIALRLLNCKADIFSACAPLWNGSAEQLFALLSDLELTIEQIDEALTDAQGVVRICQQNGIDVLNLRNDDYPLGLRSLRSPPIFFTFWGDIEVLKRPSISVVGARQPLPWVKNWFELEFAEYLSNNDLVVVSGGAMGIDQLAHCIAIRKGRRTIAVLPSGVLNTYPGSLKHFSRLIENGQMAFLSEYLPQQEMRKHFFPDRNRIISAISPALFVAQAQRKSGTIITAQHAADQGREIFALPSSPMEPTMLGNLQLLFDGAHLVRWQSDLPVVSSSFFAK